MDAVDRLKQSVAVSKVGVDNRNYLVKATVGMVEDAIAEYEVERDGLMGEAVAATKLADRLEEENAKLKREVERLSNALDIAAGVAAAHEHPSIKLQWSTSGTEPAQSKEGKGDE